MKDNPLITVIVPVYNSAYYLKKSITSILKQTYRNLEIILVDDGSTDKSGDICDRYAKKDARIKVIHKVNGGVSSARNAGIDAATGRYITFVDADDWLPEKAIEALLQAASTTNADYIAGVIESRYLFSTDHIYGDRALDSSHDGFLKIIMEHNIYPPCYGKLYSLSIIRQNGIRFPPGIRFGEDSVFVWNYLRVCRSAVCITDVTYYYSNILSGNACSHFYDDIDICLSEVVKAYDALLKKQGEESFLAKRLSEACAVARFWLVCGFYSRELPEAEALERMKEAYLLFCDYFGDIPSNSLADYTDCIESDAVELIAKQDYVTIFHRVQEKKKRVLRNNVRSFLCGIKRFIIYRMFV